MYLPSYLYKVISSLSLFLIFVTYSFYNAYVQIEEEDQTGYIRLEKFLPHMTAAIMKKDYRPHTEDKILKAFQTLDAEAKGFLTKDVLKQYLTTEGTRILLVCIIS